jgi:hypothetical protein
MAAVEPLIPLDEWIEETAWPLAGLVPDELGAIYITPPGVVGSALTLDALTAGELVFRVPGVPDVAIVVAGGIQGATRVGIEIDTAAPFAVRLVDVPLSLRLPASILRPVDFPQAEFLEIPLAQAEVGIDVEGNLDFDVTLASALPKCEVLSSGVLVDIGLIQWITPATPQNKRPTGTPPGFTGLFLDDVDVEIPGLPAAASAWSLDDAFIGTGGFSGRVQPTGITLGWSGSAFTGTAVGELFGFKGGLSQVSLEFKQNALTGFDVRGDVFLPYVDRRMGLALGLAGDGSLTATAGMPHTNQPGVTVGTDGHLIELDVGGVLGLALDQVTFERPVSGPAAVELTGVVDINVPPSVVDIDIPPIGLNGLRIDTDGNVAIEGGWLDLPQAIAVTLSGFTLEISRLGFGQDGAKPWLGLNGGLKLAEGLPMGASVEGLKIAFDPAGGLPEVSLDGVGLELAVPGAFLFAGSVAFFSEPDGNGFRGHGELGLPTLKMSVEADLVIGRTKAGETFFYFYLAVELPVGIPLLQTGAAIYGFQGLVANNMAPNRRPDEPWYHGWYVKSPKGATSGEKWGVKPGAFAIGLGATIGTAPDDGFSMSTKTLLVLVLPGPVLLLEGKGKFLSQRPGAGDPAQEGTFEALLALDVPAKLFQINLAATYDVAYLLALRGSAEVALSWAVPRPDRMWHVYLGEDTPVERRWQANVLSILDANAYFMIEAPKPGRPAIRAGAWAGLDETWTFGPVSVELLASAEVYGEISFDPQQLQGELHLKGKVAVKAFGGGVMIRASADAQVRGPTPWWVALAVKAGIEIDLWLFQFQWSQTVTLEWGDKSQPPPSPATPLVGRVALEHKLSTESFDAYLHERGQSPAAPNPVVPPDARPVVVLNRPVRDLGQLGSPSSPGQPAADVVGPAAFSYRLGHVVLVRTTGGDKVLAAAGVAEVTQGAVKLPGAPDLAAAADARMILGSAAPAKVTSAQGGSVVLDPPTAAAPGRIAYRLLGPRLAVDVQVGAAARIAGGLSDVTLGAAPPGAKDAFAGGTLVAGNQTYVVVGNTAKVFTVRTPAELPPAGAGRLEQPEGPRMEAAWLPADPADPSSTKLMIGARTPFAYFRRSERSVMDAVPLLNPDYVCGPEATPEPICVDFDDLPLGPVPKAFAVERLTAEAGGDVIVALEKSRYLGVGLDAPGKATQGETTVHFEGRVETVVVHCDTIEAGFIEALLNDDVVADAAVRGRDRGPFRFQGSIDAVRIHGSGVRVQRICFWPGWTCTGFEAATFPQGSTGEQRYAGLTHQSGGKMKVTSDGVLTVTMPPKQVQGPGHYRLVLETIGEPFPFEGMEQILERLGVRPLVLPPRELDLGLPSSGGGPGGGAGARPPHTEGTAPWLDEPAVGFLPGVGEVVLRPVPPVRRRVIDRGSAVRGTGPAPPAGTQRMIAEGREATAATLALLTSTPVVKRRAKGGRAVVSGHIWVPGAVTWVATSASLAIFLPAPATRVRVLLDDAATVTAFSGTTQLDQVQGAKGQDVFLSAGAGWIDRVLLVAQGDVRLRRICVDAGDLGWKRFEQWLWRQSVQRSVEALYSDEPLLDPGDYRLDVHVAWADDNAGSSESWSVASAPFTVGPPPGLPAGGGGPGRYPQEGALTELATYVASTLPVPGSRPHYRAYDVAVAFRTTYVSRMYLAASKPLSVAVVDANGTEIREGSPNVWGRAPDVKLSADEAGWVRTLHNDGTDNCASVDLAKVTRNEQVSAGAGELLLPDALHTGELRAGTTRVFAFDFTTSRYADFRHHVRSFVQRSRTLGATAPAALPAQVAAAATARAAVAAAETGARASKAAAETGSPTAAQLDERDSDMVALRAARAALLIADETAFRATMTAYGLGGERALPERVEVARLPGAFLLESPEPLHLDRVRMQIARHPEVPLRFTRTTFEDETLAPDIGTFPWAGREWTTTAELRVEQGLLRPRLATEPLGLTVPLDRAGSVTAVLAADAGASISLGGVRGGVAVAPAVANPTAAGDVTVTLTGAALSSVTLSGSGFAVRSITVGEPFAARLPKSGVRLVQFLPPVSAANNTHFADLTAYGDQDIEGWEIRWLPPRADAVPSRYHRFATGTKLADGATARVFGGRTNAPPSAGLQVHAGGTVGAVPSLGAILQLVDTAGEVVDEHATFRIYTGVNGVQAVPNADRTRALLLLPSGQPQDGHWRVALTFARSADLDLPRLSVGGSTTDEFAAIAFST